MAFPGFQLSLESFMLVATSTTADESHCLTVIPSRARDLGRWGEAPPQMLRRCGWLCMTLSEQRRGLFIRGSYKPAKAPSGRCGHIIIS